MFQPNLSIFQQAIFQTLAAGRVHERLKFLSYSHLIVRHYWLLRTRSRTGSITRGIKTNADKSRVEFVTTKSWRLAEF